MYLFTASKPSSIRIGCRARLLRSNEDSLVTVSSNLIHVHQRGSLNPIYELICYGRITTVTPFASYDSSLEHIFVTTEDQRYFTLSYADGKISTGATGDVTTQGLSTPEIGHRVIVNNHYIIMYLFNGIISVIPIHQAANSRKRALGGNKLIGKPQQIRLDEMKIHDIAMLHSEEDRTVFGVLFRDLNLTTQFKAYELVIKKHELELRKGPFTMSNLENGTNMILSRGLDGVICIGESTLYTKSSSSNQMEYPISTPTLFNSKTQLPDSTWVLGDDYGLLYLLSFDGRSPVLKQLPMPKDPDSEASTISIPHVLVACDEELFVGSHYGDSQLLSFPSLEVISRKTNIGPIQDILVNESQDGTGSSSIITASGAYKDGALKVVRYGVGMSDKAELEMDRIRGVWGIDELSIVVVSFVDSYIVLHVSSDGEIEEVGNGEEELIYAYASRDKLVLVLRNELKLCSDGVTIQSHSIDSATSAYVYADELFLLCSRALEVYAVADASFTKRRTKTFENEISAFTIAHDTLVIGFWNSGNLWIGDVNFQEVTSELLDEGMTPHSIVLQEISSMRQPSLLVAMNDGSLLSYQYEPKSRHLTSKKKTILGTIPVSLHVFSTKQGPNVFAVSDRPTIIHAARNKLAFSSINIPSCSYFTSFRSKALQSCMIVATESGLRIGEIDDIQKLQFKSVALGELPRRLTTTSGTIGLITMRMEVEMVTGNESQRSYLKTFDPTTYERNDEFELQENEMCQSICDVRIDAFDRIVVGTSFADSEQDECTRGRIIVFGINEVDKTLWIVSQIEVSGSVYCIKPIGTRLIAGVNSFVRLYDVSQESLTEISKFRTSTYALTMAVHEQTVLVGDLMKSVLYLKVEAGELSEIARDYVPTWMTSVAFADENTFLGAEAEGNLVLLRNSDSPLEENKMRLERIGEFKYGEMINILVPGVLVMPDDTKIVKPHTLFGTVDGSIGVIGTISPDYINLLIQLQANIGDVRVAIGGLKHSDYRAYKCNGVSNLVPTRFVDGDLIEEFLELTSEQQDIVCRDLGKTVVEVEAIVEDLSRLR